MGLGLIIQHRSHLPQGGWPEWPGIRNDILSLDCFGRFQGHKKTPLELSQAPSGKPTS